MVPPELIRRFPFFSGLSMDQINALAKVANEETVDTGHTFLREDEEICCFYVTLEGAVAIVFELPERGVEHTVSEQFARKLKTKDVVISTVGPGEVFGWSGLVPPHKATATAKALTPCRVISFDCRELRSNFEEDCRFGYLMMQKAAQLIGQRLRDTRIQSLADYITE
jgi:CRP/FNR family cyclic AMP-dependent transcriptional regulator